MSEGTENYRPPHLLRRSASPGEGRQQILAQGQLDIARVLAPKGVIYIREPLGVTQRLTLKEHFSNDLATTYSSVYRSLAEFRQLLKAVSDAQQLTLQTSDALYPSDLDNRSETRQFYFLLTKSEP